MLGCPLSIAYNYNCSIYTRRRCRRNLWFCVPSSGWVESTWQDLQCLLWVGVDYHVADRRDSREYADREVAGKTARGIRWNYAGEDRLLGCGDGDMLGCVDGRRSVAANQFGLRHLHTVPPVSSLLHYLYLDCNSKICPDGLRRCSKTHTYTTIHLSPPVPPSYRLLALCHDPGYRNYNQATKTNSAARKPVTVAGTCEARSLRRVKTLHHSRMPSSGFVGNQDRRRIGECRVMDGVAA
jgi:hypothetical protein